MFLNYNLFRIRIASPGPRLSFCALLVMLLRALFVGFSFGLRRCGNFRAAALAGARPWHIACARLSCCGVAGLPAARVARRLGQRQGAAKHNRTNKGPKFPHSFLLQGLFDASIAPGVRLGEHQNTQIGATWILKSDSETIRQPRVRRNHQPEHA